MGVKFPPPNRNAVTDYTTGVLPWNGAKVKTFAGINWMVGPNTMSKNSSGKFLSYVFHKSAVGYEGDPTVKTKIEHNMDDEWEVMDKFNAAAGVIDAGGIIRLIV